jgi:hypothetical protein
MSKIQVNSIVNHYDNGAPDCPMGLTVTGVSTFTGSVDVSGISTFNKLRVGSATTFADDLVVNGDARITGILTIGTGSITLDPNNDEIKLGQTKLKRDSDGEIKITDLQGNLKGLRGKRFRVQVAASEKEKDGIEVGTGATITSPADNVLSFRTNDHSRITILSNGNVGIGSTIPNAALNINESNGGLALSIKNTAPAKANNKYLLFMRDDTYDDSRYAHGYYNEAGYPVFGHSIIGTSLNYASVYAGRTRSDADSPANYYRHGAHSFDAYSARTDDSANYRSRIFARAWDAGDDGDRNAIYYVNSGSDTTTVDYDQHQKFGVKASGMAQWGATNFVGRVESDESTPNSVYLGASGTGMLIYPSSSSYYTYVRTRTTDNTDDVYKVDSGGGVVIKFQSDGNGRFDGGADVGAASDYAEYFEWLDGNTSSADRRGITVVLDGEKIRPATDGDDASKIIGVVSALPAVVGDSAWSEWQLAHQKDAYGSWVTKDEEFLVWNKFGTFTDTDGVKKPNPQPNVNDYNMSSEHQILVSDIEAEKAKGNVPQAAIDQNLRVTKPSRTYNPDYDPNITYVPRSQRKEWEAIGLVGKLVVRRGQPIGSNWILMKSNVGVDPNDNSIVLDRYLVR